MPRQIPRYEFTTTPRRLIFSPLVGFVLTAVYALALLAAAGAITWLLVSAGGEAVRVSCIERCEGRGQRVASHTVYGCECTVDQ